MRIIKHNLSGRLMVKRNWSRAKRFLAEIFALGPESWQAKEDGQTLLVGIDEFSGERMMEIEPLDEEEDVCLT
jgi:hypothetical protein